MAICVQQRPVIPGGSVAMSRLEDAGPYHLGRPWRYRFSVIMDVAKNMWTRAAGACIRSDAVDSIWTLASIGALAPALTQAVAQSGDAGVRDTLEVTQRDASGVNSSPHFGAQRGVRWCSHLLLCRTSDDRRRLGAFTAAA